MACPYDRDGQLVRYVRGHGRPWTPEELAKVLRVPKGALKRFASRGVMPSDRDRTGVLRFDPKATANWLVKRKWRV